MSFNQGILNNLDERSFDDPSRLSDDINNDAAKYAKMFKALAEQSEGMTSQVNPNIPGLLQARPYQPVAQQPMPQQAMPQQMMPNAYMQMLQNMMNRGY